MLTGGDMYAACLTIQSCPNLLARFVSSRGESVSLVSFRVKLF